MYYTEADIFLEIICPDPIDAKGQPWHEETLGSFSQPSPLWSFKRQDKNLEPIFNS
jgi:hypothetical protein